MTNIHFPTARTDLLDLIAEIDRYAVDADFDTALDDLQREFAERLYERHA